MFDLRRGAAILPILTCNLFYFAYGSNLNHVQMQKRCPQGRFIARARLDGFKFTYDGYSKKRKGAVANIIKDEHSAVWGGLYKISEKDLSRLDLCEGYPRAYKRRPVFVEDEEGKTYHAIIYYRTGKKEGSPSQEYRKTVLKGAKDCGLPEDYREETF